MPYFLHYELALFECIDVAKTCIVVLRKGASTAAAYIFTAPNCTTIIINLGPCVLNAEFQHFILKFNKISLLC
jgi:hypothetical protein